MITPADIENKVFSKAVRGYKEEEVNEFLDEITVSTNFFVLWYANKPLFWGSMAGIAALLGLAFWFFVIKKRDKEDE